MNKLINEVKKEMEAEVKEQELKEEKANIRAMLSLIKSLEEQTESLNKQLKAVKNDLDKGEYGRVSRSSNTITPNSTVDLVGNMLGITTTSQ